MIRTLCALPVNEKLLLHGACMSDYQRGDHLCNRYHSTGTLLRVDYRIRQDPPTAIADLA